MVAAVNNNKNNSIPVLQLPPPPNLLTTMTPWSLDSANSFKTVRLKSSDSFSSALGSSPNSDAGSSTRINSPRLACTYEFPALAWVARRPALLFGLAPFAFLVDLLWGVLLCQQCACHYNHHQIGCCCCSRTTTKKSVTTIAEPRKRNTAFNVSFRDVNHQHATAISRCGSNASTAYSVRALPLT